MPIWASAADRIPGSRDFAVAMANSNTTVLANTLNYDDAKRESEEWLSQMAGASVRSVKRATVKAALNAYLTDLRRHGRTSAANPPRACSKP